VAEGEGKRDKEKQQRREETKTVVKLFPQLQ